MNQKSAFFDLKSPDFDLRLTSNSQETLCIPNRECLKIFREKGEKKKKVEKMIKKYAKGPPFAFFWENIFVSDCPEILKADPRWPRKSPL